MAPARPAMWGAAHLVGRHHSALFGQPHRDARQEGLKELSCPCRLLPVCLCHHVDKAQHRPLGTELQPWAPQLAKGHEHLQNTKQHIRSE